MELENLKMEQNETLNLAKEMKELNILQTEVSEAETAKSAIENLSDEDLANYIKKELQEQDWLRLTYVNMKTKPFFWFMVQACIKKLSNNENYNKKYDDNWDVVDNDNGWWKTLAERLENVWWIDNKYWEWTKNLVMMIQKILWINEDGFAGPQFFAKICSILTNGNIGEFQVEWYGEGNNYPFGFDNNENTSNVGENQESKKFNLSWGDNINFTMDCYDWISIDTESKDLWEWMIWYKLNLPNYCDLKVDTYVYMKDWKLLCGNPRQDSWISEYLSKTINHTTCCLKLKDNIKPHYESYNIDNITITCDDKIKVIKNSTNIVAEHQSTGKKCTIEEDENNKWHCYITDKNWNKKISPDFKAEFKDWGLTISLKNTNDKRKDFKTEVGDVLNKIDKTKTKWDISVAYKDVAGNIHYSIYHPDKQYPTLKNCNKDWEPGYPISIPNQKEIFEFADKLDIHWADTFYKMTAKAVNYASRGTNSSVMDNINWWDNMKNWTDRNQAKMYYWCKDQEWVKADKTKPRPEWTRASEFLKRCNDHNLRQDQTDIWFWLTYKNYNIKDLYVIR